ncbi:phytanoyl-CoA dioxygenase family protein [Bacillus sp. ISL-18]|uniref:phytanoyl-CoA dioxygenase family protein n=1 Tax=Bacillus sp. ISL-18 TaxID=2819118 RepID=UPI001BEC132B|nr:phytanoyl-CoA dioxygenase family protein [Bacillus sp. ISL-18]MBT2657171.1 phytanoyl-CoA dioxygenase family protein [Bacillus sp. ISL-18]
MFGGKVLSQNDIEQFIELGWVKVPQAFERKAALKAQDYLWKQLEKRGVERLDRTTWTEPMLRLNENYDTEEFRLCDSERLSDAIEDLVGTGRWVGRGIPNRWGWWPVNFSEGSHLEWDVPTNGWHWDGIHFKHHVDSPDQGLLCLCVFSDIGPRGGGTLVAEGSHKVIARYLAEQQNGVTLEDGIQAVNKAHQWFGKLTGQEGTNFSSSKDTTRVDYFMNQTVKVDEVNLRVVETTAEAGDVYLCHPFLYHASSQNHSGIPRFMCNRTTPLGEKLNLRRRNEPDYSPLEFSIRKAL